MRTPLQFVLDFFTGTDPEPPAPSAQPKATPAAAQGYTHPAANRHVQLQGMAVSYRFERSRRRSIGFVVGAEGLVVRAPAWVSLREVDAAVQEKGAWILAKLQQFRQRQSEHVRQAIDWSHGADIPYLGSTVRLCVLERGTVPEADDAGVQTLQLSLPPGASAVQVREAAEIWFKQKARPLFEERLSHFAPRLGVRWTRLSLSGARTRWGSAGSDGHIRLNWRLIHLPLAQIDYVVVHELAHLREMNHGPKFWDTVGGVMPDYRERRQQLRQSALGAPED